MSKNNTALQQTSQIIPGFNGQGTINIDEFKKIKPKVFKDATFIRYWYLDLANVDIEDPSFWNTGIRSESGNNEERVQSFQVSFRKKGFLTTEFPPAIDTDMNLIGGRGRIAAAKLNGERFIPVAQYSRTNTSTKNEVTNGLRENLHNPQSSSKFDDFVAGGVHLISVNQLKREKASIENWLYNEVEIDNWYDNSICGQVTKIVEKIFSLSKPGQSLIISRPRKEWDKWIKTNLGLEKKNYELVSIDQEAYVDRLWASILEKASSNLPVKVILYTNTDTATDARSKLSNFQKRMDKLVNGTYSLINSVHGADFPQRSNSEIYTVLGAIPQIIGTHPVTEAELVDIEKY